MALIKCKSCGQMVSDRAEKCPKCGYPVRLSMEQQEETEKKETIKNVQPRQKNSKKGILIAAVVVVVIGCGIFAILNGQQQDKRSEIKGNNTLSQTGMNGVKTQNEQQSPKQIQANSADRVEAENTHSQIVGTYEFQVHIPNMDNVVTAYSFDNGFTKERRQIGTIDGVEYMVVHPDMRVSILEPGDRKKYVGTVNEVVEGVFTVKCSNDDGKFGHGYILYESGREIGTSGNNYGGYGVFVVDTKNHRVYKTVEEYKGSDISDTEHLMYDSFTPTVRTSNTTEWQRNYFDQYKDDYED